MKKVYVFIYLMLIGLPAIMACPTVTPRFTFTNNHTCGLPGVIAITNTSTGTASASTNTLYLWKRGGKIVDSTYGLTSPSNILLKDAGLHILEIVAVDSTGCRDSFSSIATVSTRAPKLKDVNGINSHAPEWLNCIQFRSDSDSFRVKVASTDTLYNATVIWGDGSSNSSSTKLSPGDSLYHYYTKTGTFTYKVIVTDPSTNCTDTLYGSVINQRQPTAGITGPSSGFNRGCAPHTITFKSASYNVTKETTISWQFGDGKSAVQNAVTDPDSISHTYTGALCNGTVTLIASNVCGQSQTTWNPIDISEKDRARIEVDTSNCDPAIPFTFYNMTTDLYCNLPDPKQYFWDFGDGDTTGWITTKAAQSHLYNDEGEVEVKLIAKNKCGSDTFIYRFTVVYTPEPNFTLSDSTGCQPVSVTATDLSKGWGITRSWDFGDGNTSTDSIASNVYTTGGDYTLKLSVTNGCGTVDTTHLIRVFDKPVADFTVRGQGCVPYQQQYHNKSQTFSDSTTFDWDFGDGTSSNLQNPPGKKYTIGGNYVVVLDITNTCGTSSDTVKFEMFNYPVLTVNGDSTICTFDSFGLSVSANLSSTYVIDWGDSTSTGHSSDGIYKHVYFNSGNKQIITTGTGPGGCPTKDTFNLYVKPGALANFFVDKDFACAPATFTISDSSKNASDYWWYINGQLESTLSSFNSHSITTDSTVVEVQLKVKNSGLCRVDSITKVIFTPNKPHSTFALSDSANCAPFAPVITNTSQGAISYDWDLGNSTTSTSYEPAASYNASNTQDTSYKLSLIATNWAGCNDTSDINITVYPKPLVQFATNESAGCGPLSVNFTNTSSPRDTGSIQIMTFNWSLGDGTSSSSVNPGNLYSTSLTKDTFYNVKLIGLSEHQCSDSATQVIQVYPRPTAKLTPSSLDGCGPLDVQLVNQSLPNDTGSINDMTFNWTLNGSSSSSISPNAIFRPSKTQDSIHRVELIAISEHGCADTIHEFITVFPKPVAAFTINNPTGCTPHTVNLINNSIPNDTGNIQIMTFNWDLGNGSNSTVQNPNNSYVSQANADSTYHISLIATSEHGCKDTTSNSITIHPRPKSDFGSDNNTGCGPLTVNFDERTTNANQYFWNFGQGWSHGSANEQRTFNPILLFDTVYQVSITSTSVHGCTGDTMTRPIRVLGTPQAEFILSKDTSCNDEVTLFYNTSLAAIRYHWDFGDNTDSKLINPTKTFKADNLNGKAITYPIKLTATSVFGCSDTLTQFFTAAPLPKAKVAFDKLDGCGDLNINFTNASQFGNTQRWSFGEGSTSTQKNPSFTYTNNTPTAKQFVVTLESFANAGCKAVDTSTVTVYPTPSIGAQAIRTNICDSGKFEFLTSGSNIQLINWKFGDGSMAEVSAQSSKPYLHQFPRSIYGDTSFNVQITAMSNKGCTDSIFKKVNLNPRVLADFDQTPNSACVPAAADFTNKSRNATNYVWEFGDGGGSGDVNPSYIYNKAGTYSVKLSAFDQNGCKSVKLGSNNFVARETPIAEFVMSSGQLKLPNAQASFTNLSIYKSPTQFEWDFGDGSPISADLNPVHTYADTGAYKVKLLAKNSSCQDVIIKQVIVDPSLPLVNFEPEGAVGCAPLGVQFKEKTQYAQKFTWYFGDGNSSTEANPFHVYENDGFYSVTLIAEGPGGTSKIVRTNVIEVKKTPRVYFYASPDSAHLPNARFDMENKSIHASTYSWEVNKSDNQLLVGASTLKNPSFIINEVGNYDVTLMATNTNQCHDTLTKPLMLIVLEQGQIYVPTGFTPNRDNINDVFKPIMLGVDEIDYTFRIFDRWGEKIFETKDKKAGWDGTVKQNKVAENVFVWTISGKFADGTFFNKKGTVTLLR